jgi:membrane-bound serine protease (ClpP class)
MVELFAILIVAGLFLIGAEIFLPGGIIGFIGGMCLLAAIAVGFVAFGMQAGILIALLIVILAGVCLVIWIKFFPKTRMGLSLTLSDDGKTFKSASPEFMDLLNKEGVVLSTLRPAGIATIGGKRVDVVADGSWIESGKPIKVTRVEGVRILVREIASATGAKDSGA